MTYSSLEDLKTPCLLLDIDRVKANAARMTAKTSALGVKLRPHIKTHKCVEVARIQTEGHNEAVTVSTLAEAKSFAANGFNDFTYAVPIEPGKFNEAIEIVRGGAKLNVITDDAGTSELLNEAAKKRGVKISVFVEVDCGDHRSGLNPTSDAAISIPRAITDASNLEFAGLLTHGGHSYGAGDLDGVQAIARQERDVMTELADRLRNQGIHVPAISIGSTPTIVHAEDLTGIDEVRPGNYIFFDAFQATIGSCSFEDCALTVLAAVVHRSYEQKKVIIDAGGIALSKDRGPFEREPDCGYGRVQDIDGNDLGLRVNGVSQEHGVIPVKGEATLGRLSVGTRVRVVANHSCLTAAQHSHYNVLENGAIVDKWEVHRGW